MVVAEQNNADADFVDALETWSKARAPHASAGELDDADRSLNVIYQQAMKVMQPCPTCSADGGKEGRETLRAAQRSWIKYRDAWAAYYVTRWSSAAPVETLEREIRRALTRKRIELLRRQLDEG
jgi:uncharacterized protein YecT (DUF1311 family)